MKSLAKEEYCYLTTTGRVTGRPHKIEIWFALEVESNTLYMLSGNLDRSDWVKNALKQPEVTLKLGDRTFKAQARKVKTAKEDALARRLLDEKYSPTNDDLEEWMRTALPVAFELMV